MYRYERSSQRFTRYRHDSLDPSSISMGEATGFYQDRAGTRWVSTSGGLDRMDSQPGKFKHYRHLDSDTTTISSSSILAVLEDHTGRYWVGTNGGGLNLMDRATGKFKHFLPWSIVTQIVEDASGTLWVASSAGLHRYDRKRGTFMPFTDPGTGKPLPFPKALIEDNRGNLWTAVSNGIAVISPDRKSLRLFGANYGIPPGEDFFFGGSYKRRDGSIYFGSMERYFHFQPDELLRDRPITPLLNLSAFRIHNQLVRPGSDGPLHATLSQAKSIALAYNQNDFSIDFAAIDFRHPELHLYTYKLENYDLDWSPVSPARTANYFNVPPGKYHFRARAAGNDGVWVEKSIFITVSPPWWRTGWAYGLYVFILLGSFFGGWRMLLRRERRKNESKIQELKALQALELDQLKSDFFTNVTHEFRTPLTLILSPLEHWLSTMSANDPYAQPFRSMQRNGRRLLHLVNQLLDLSKLEAGKMRIEAQPGDLIHTVRRIAHSFASLADSRGISFHVAAPEGNLWLSFDADKLEKILNNLLSNAFKFTADNGRISLSLQVLSDAQVSHQSEKPYVLVQLKVTDSGPGIPASELERIFDRFHQIDNSLAREHEGSGIGLALTRELVELQKGTIIASSTLGQGSQFVVSLPLELLHSAQLGHLNTLSTQVSILPEQRNEASVFGKIPDIELSSDPETPLVLVVEDNADLRHFIRESLSEHSLYRILEATNGVDGYKLACEHIPDLVISDIMMPKMDGMELCQRLKTDQNTSHVPVILLTAKTSVENKLQGLETGADDYLTKPFEVRELLIRVANLIEGRRQLKERFTREVVLQPSNIVISSIDEQFLNRALAVIEQYMADENFSVETFGKEVGMSRMQLYRKLLALTGQSPSDFIRTIRLQRAAQLLSANSGTVAQIADSVGFASHSYFSKCFQEQYGRTPSAFVADLPRTIH
ncbi:response regulator [Dyadobacter pollutisoli]|uniref:histidine kinase n=1 Tax=Dyadobacter pollutisoli TaxID=2910158 RepID=A0A9E8SLY0_9BACT|nr:response regulator [Dyadobacter pollutisoli]WAC09227.1 response regulator [Dyadobacter pollutisoli]